VAATVRPLREDEFDSWRASSCAGYAESMIVSGGLPPDAARKRAEADYAELLPDGLSTAGHSVYVVEEEGEPVGSLWVAERDGDGDRSLVTFAVEVDENRRGRGLGRAAMVFAEEEARRRGISAVALNVFGGNEVARNLYRSLGYREVAVWMRKEL
jgi:GNAT superfamily N-acetyltransferase